MTRFLAALIVLAVVLLCLTGCNATPPDGAAIKAAVEACERQGGRFQYHAGIVVKMECYK